MSIGIKVVMQESEKLWKEEGGRKGQREGMTSNPRVRNVVKRFMRL